MHTHTCEDCLENFICADSIIDCRTEFYTCRDCWWSNFVGFMRLTIWATLFVLLLLVLFR